MQGEKKVYENIFKFILCWLSTPGISLPLSVVNNPNKVPLQITSFPLQTDVSWRRTELVSSLPLSTGTLSDLDLCRHFPRCHSPVSSSKPQSCCVWKTASCCHPVSLDLPLFLPFLLHISPNLVAGEGNSNKDIPCRTGCSEASHSLNIVTTSLCISSHLLQEEAPQMTAECGTELWIRQNVFGVISCYVPLAEQ